MGFGGLDEIPRQVRQQAVIGVNQREVDRDTVLHRWIGTPLGAAITVGLVGGLLPDLGPVVRRGGLLDMGQECRPLAHACQAPSEQSPGGPHRGGVHLGLGEPATAQPHRHLRGIDRLVRGLAPLDGLHLARVAQDASHARTGAAIGHPIPGEATFDANHHVLAVGGNRVQQRFRTGVHVPVAQDLSLLVQEAEGPWCGRASRSRSNTCAAWCRIA